MLTASPRRDVAPIEHDRAQPAPVPWLQQLRQDCPAAAQMVDRSMAEESSQDVFFPSNAAQRTRLGGVQVDEALSKAIAQLPKDVPAIVDALMTTIVPLWHLRRGASEQTIEIRSVTARAGAFLPRRAYINQSLV